MVLVIDSNPLLKVPATTDDFYNAYPKLVDIGLNFTHQSTREVEGKHCLYVGQGEFAVVPGSDKNVRTIGSDDATTCHIIIVRHASSGTVALAHFDGRSSERTAVRDMIDKIKKIEGNVDGLELCVVGGYLPEKGSSEAEKNESENLSLKIIRLFMEHRCNFNLTLWCTCSINTTIQPGIGPKPIVYGVGVDIQSGLIFPAYFKCHEPNLPLRAASRWMGGDQGPHDLYDHHTSTITIHPFTYSGLGWFDVYLRLPDDALLKNFSTSPKVEPSRFCEEMRKVFKIFVDHPYPQQTLFPDNQAKQYKLKDTGLWELIEDQLDGCSSR